MNKGIFVIIFILLFSSIIFSDDINSINHELAINDFTIMGFGQNFVENRIYGIDILKHFGNIIDIKIKKNWDNSEYLVIEFNSIIIKLFNTEYIDIFKNQNITNEIFSNFRIYSIYAKRNVKYLFDIEIGMHFEDLVNIFGEIIIGEEKHFDFENKRISIFWSKDNGSLFMVLGGTYGHYLRDRYVLIIFNENKNIEDINWVL